MKESDDPIAGMSDLLNSVGKFLQLDHASRMRLFRAVWLLLASRIEHRLSSSEAILNRLKIQSTEPRVGLGPNTKNFDPEQATRAIEVAARHVPWRSDCLIKAMAAARWLHNNGYQPTVHVGVAKRDDGTIGAHAWLTLNDQILVGADEVVDPSRHYRQLNLP